MAPINVLHINSEMSWAGGETQTHYLIQSLRDRGYQQSVACQPDSALAKRCRKENIPVHLVKMPTQFSLSAVLRLRRIMQAEKFQIMHCHTSRAHTLGVVASLGVPGLARVVTRRMEHRTGGWWKVILLYNQGVEAVVGVCGAVRDVLMSAGVKVDLLRVIPSSVDTKKFANGDGELWHHRLGFSGDETVISLVAILTWRKGCEILLRAVPNVLRKHPTCRFLIAGDGPSRPALERMAKELGVDHSVVFTGFVDDIPGILAASDIVVLPSLKEAAGGAVLEAMAAGKSVVASRVGGIPESVVDGETGLLVNAGDHEALSRAIITLLDNPALRAQFGRTGRARVEAKFSVDAMGQQYDALYHELLMAKVHVI